MRPIDEIIIHCSDTDPDWMKDQTAMVKMAEIRRWHTSPPRNWRDVGYHFLIDRSGVRVTGRPLEATGAHTKGHNSHSIGICLVGGRGGSADDNFRDNFTQAQNNELRKLIAELKRTFPTITKVSGHNEYAAKACPTFNVKRWYDRLDADGEGNAAIVHTKGRKSVTQSGTVRGSVVQGASAFAGIVGALQALDGAAQIIAVTGCVIVGGLAVFILRERLKAWASGWR